MATGGLTHFPPYGLTDSDDVYFDLNQVNYRKAEEASPERLRANLRLRRDLPIPPLVNFYVDSRIGYGFLGTDHRKPLYKLSQP